MKSGVPLEFKREQETRCEYSDDCQILLKYTKRKDDRNFIEESSRVKKEAKEMRDFFCIYGKGVTR